MVVWKQARRSFLGHLAFYLEMFYSYSIKYLMLFWFVSLIVSLKSVQCTIRLDHKVWYLEPNFVASLGLNQFWTSLNKFEQVWTNLNKFDPIWSSLNKFESGDKTVWWDIDVGSFKEHEGHYLRDCLFLQNLGGLRPPWSHMFRRACHVSFWRQQGIFWLMILSLVVVEFSTVITKGKNL